jgi:hypothetical protein
MNYFRFVQLPFVRLSAYFCQALLELTPRQNPQFLPIFSLLRSTGLIIDVLNTVKHEEDHHRMLSSLLARFQGTHSVTEMADRKRTLLWHGSLLLRLAKEEITNSGFSPHVYRTRQLTKAITTWDTHNVTSLRKESHHSISSYDSLSSYSSSEDDSQDGSPTCTPTSIPVYAAVLSDLVLFGAYSPGTSGRYRLIDGIGKARVFTVHELGKASSSDEHLPLITPNRLLKRLP